MHFTHVVGTSHIITALDVLDELVHFGFTAGKWYATGLP